MTFKKALTGLAILAAAVGLQIVLVGINQQYWLMLIIPSLAMGLSFSKGEMFEMAPAISFFTAAVTFFAPFAGIETPWWGWVVLPVIGLVGSRDLLRVKS